MHFNSQEELDAALRGIEHAGSISGVYDTTDDIFEYESLSETSDYMTPEDNDDQPTIEAYENGILVYDNVNKFLPNG
jgi:hypothetical protein